MNKIYESVDWDAKNNGVIVTKQERISLQDVSGIEEAKTKLREELRLIVFQIKELQNKGNEIKSLLLKLDEKTGSIDDPVQIPD